MQPKPPECHGCAYENIGGGFIPPDPIEPHTRLLVVGEAGGAEEEAQAEGFVGPSGRHILVPALEQAGFTPWADVARSNVVLCRPPGNKFPGKEIAWECMKRHQPAIVSTPDNGRSLQTSTITTRNVAGAGGSSNSARQSVAADTGHLPLLACGANATEALSNLRLPATKTRGTVLPVRGGGWCVSTLHPAYLLRGREGTEMGKAQDHLRPLLAQDAKRALHSTPRIPTIRPSTPDKTIEAFRLDKPAFFEFDLESREGKPTLLGVAWNIGEAWVLEWSDRCGPLLEEMWANALPAAHNAAFDVPEVEAAGVKPPGEWIDSINLSAAYDASLPQGLQSQVLTWVPGSMAWKGLIDHRRGYGVETPDVLRYGGLWTETLTRLGRRVPKNRREWFVFYNGLDAAWGLELTVRLRDQLKAQGRLGLYTDVMQPLQGPLLEMGDRGLKVSPKRLRHHRAAADRLVRMARHALNRVSTEMLKKQAEANGTLDLFGEAPTFNPDSHKQKTELIHGHLGLPKVTKKGTKGHTLDKTALESLASRVARGTVKPKHSTPEAAMTVLRSLLAISVWSKWRDVHLRESVAKKGVLQTQYTQHRNKAGRVSSGTDDDEDFRAKRLDFGNLQNFPRKVRDMIVPHGRGRRFVGLDYAAIQWAIMMYFASLLPDSNGFHLRLLKKHQANKFDPHRYLASVAFQVAEPQVTRKQRSFAKAFTFGRGFLGSPTTLGRKKHIPDSISRKVCDAHEEAFRLGELQREILRLVTKPGQDPNESPIGHLCRRRYTQTPLGWRRWYWGPRPKETDIIASLIQGTEGDIMKWALARMSKELKGLPEDWLVGGDWHIDTETHDSVLLCVPKAEVAEAQAWGREMLEAPTPFLGGRTWRTDGKTGRNWAECS